MLNLNKIVGINYECIPLAWDTDYFGIKSARINLASDVDEVGQNEIIDFCSKYDFITILNLNNIKDNNQWIGSKTTAFLADVNIQFLKELKGLPQIMDESTVVFRNYKRNEEIINIAGNSFMHSRFFNDPNLPIKEASNIYLHWTECAFENDDKYFVICKRDNQIAGYILFSINATDQTAIIELIAVHEYFRGQRVGKSLIQTMETYLIEKNIKKIKVGTQVDNVSAAQFYNSVGFKYVSCSAVYHLWK
jgi:ribosomal protein S18 acetylase RimI-like enzyme